MQRHWRRMAFTWLKRIIIVLSIAFVFFVVRFPYSDLSDFIVSQINRQLRQQAAITSDQVDLSFLPLEIDFQNLAIMTAYAAPVAIGEVGISPLLSQILMFRPGAALVATDLLGGSASAWWKGRTWSFQPDRDLTQEFSIELNDIQLGKISALVPAGPRLTGSVSAQLEGSVDLGWKKAPEFIPIKISGKQIESSPFQLRSYVGGAPIDIPLPGLKLTQLTSEAEWKEGELVLTNVQLGSEKDAVSLRLKDSRIGLSVTPAGTRFSLTPGSYSFKGDLRLKKIAAKEWEMLGVFLGSCRKSTSDGERFIFQASSSNINYPPKISCLSQI